MDDNSRIAGSFRREEMPMPEPPQREPGADDDEVPFHVPRD